MFLGDRRPASVAKSSKKGDQNDERSCAHQTPNIEDEIRRRAYELFEARGGEAGQELEDWLRAEAEIRGSKTNAVAA